MADLPTPSSTPELLTFTAQIVAAHVAANTVPVDALPAIILSVHGALVGLGTPAVEAPVQEPAVPIKRSIQPEYLICLEDGGKVKMLKRYLKARFGLTPDAYRTKWGLPRDYPMVAPGYSAKRSALAKQFGLGPALRTVEQSAPAAATPEPEMPTVPTVPAEPEARHTAASVFANFPGEAPMETASAAAGKDKPGRRRFVQQSVQARRRRSATRPM